MTGCVPASMLVSELCAAQVTIPSEFDTSLESVAVAFRGSSGMTLGYMSKQDYRFSSLVLGIVKSPAFQMRTKARASVATVAAR